MLIGMTLGDLLPGLVKSAVLEAFPDHVSITPRGNYETTFVGGQFKVVRHGSDFEPLHVGFVLLGQDEELAEADGLGCLLSFCDFTVHAAGGASESHHSVWCARAALEEIAHRVKEHAGLSD